MVAITEIATAMALPIVRIETAIAMAFQITRTAARTTRAATDGDTRQQKQVAIAGKQVGTRTRTSASRTGLQHRYGLRSFTALRSYG
jgi:hypothetical protein